MINVNEIPESTLGALIDWLEADISREYFLPKMLELRAVLLSRLVSESENKDLANILRGQIQLADKFLNLHDELLAAREGKVS